MPSQKELAERGETGAEWGQAKQGNRTRGFIRDRSLDDHRLPKRPRQNNAQERG
jgi:hypothetical protein